MQNVEHPLTVDHLHKVGGIEGHNGPRGEQWIPGKYATLPALKRQATTHGVSVPAKATKQQVVELLRAAGVEPRRPGLPD